MESRSRSCSSSSDQKLETPTIRGTCLCGAVSFEVKDAVEFRFCHCSRCRKARGTAFASNIFARPDGFKWLSGETNLATYRVPTAQRFRNTFCKTCGSPMPQNIESLGMMLIPAGTLDGDPGIRPAYHIFAESKAPWDEITDQLPQHKQYPPPRS